MVSLQSVNTLKTWLKVIAFKFQIAQHIIQIDIIYTLIFQNFTGQMDSLNKEIQGRILTQFKKLHFDEQSQISKQQLFHALDFICFQNSGMKMFSPKLKSKLWHQCTKNAPEKTILMHFNDVLSKEITGTLSLIAKSEDLLKVDELCLQEKIQLKKKLIQYRSQHKYLNLTFKLSHTHQQNKENMLQLNENPEKTELDIEKQQERDELQSLRNENGDLFLRVFLRKKGVSQSAIQKLQNKNLTSIGQLQEMTMQDLCMTGLKMSDSILIKKL